MTQRDGGSRGSVRAGNTEQRSEEEERRAGEAEEEALVNRGGVLQEPSG